MPEQQELKTLGALKRLQPFSSPWGLPAEYWRVHAGDRKLHLDTHQTTLCELVGVQGRTNTASLTAGACLDCSRSGQEAPSARCAPALIGRTSCRTPPGRGVLMVHTVVVQVQDHRVKRAAGTIR